MIKRDIIQAQIEELGRVLGKVMADFLKLANDGNVNDVIEITEQQLENELNLDTEKVLNLASKDLETYLNSLNLSYTHLDQLAEYYYEVGLYLKEHLQTEVALNYFETAKKIINLASKKTDTFTIERMNLRNSIQEALSID